MDIELWTKYVDMKRNGTSDEKLAIMLECAELEDDVVLCRDARYDLAQLFLKGEGVDKDREQAMELLRSSADMGNIKAMEQIGLLLIEEGSLEEGSDYLQKNKANKLPDEELDQIAGNIARVFGRLL